MRCLAVVAALTWVGQAVAAAEPPPELVEYTEEQAALCRDVGGEPHILASYQTVHDLNGDGRDDFLTNLAGLECENAWSAFCGSAGCEVSAWLSEPSGGYHRFDFGNLQGIRIEDAAPLPRLVAGYHGAFCDDPARSGAESCSRTWTFSSNDPAVPPVDPGEPQAADAAPAGEPAIAAAEAPAPGPRVQAIAPGWTLRNVPGSSPVALGGGTGSLAFLAAFCLGGKPFLAVTFHERPQADEVALRFAFSQGAIDAKAQFEDGAGGAYVVPLADGDLAARLGGRDSTVPIDVNGAPQGALSLSGSTRSLRGALEACR